MERSKIILNEEEPSLEEVLDVRRFILWFFKHPRNNQLYLMSVSHIELEGFSAQLFPIPDLDRPVSQKGQEEEEVRLAYQSITESEHSSFLSKTDENKTRMQKVQERLRLQLEQWKNTQEKTTDNHENEKEEIRQC